MCYASAKRSAHALAPAPAPGRGRLHDQGTASSQVPQLLCWHGCWRVEVVYAGICPRGSVDSSSWTPATVSC
jgi:hypothetical protein